MICLKTKVRTTSLDEKNEQNSGLDFLSLLDVKIHVFLSLTTKRYQTQEDIRAFFINENVIIIISE